MADTQINVGMNVDGVITGTDKAKRKIGELGGAAREAGRGTGAIGDGMAATSQKVESATRNMIASIQRQTAALESGSKASREYQESLARSRGVDTAALRPYLDQLDAVREKQERAEQASELMKSAGEAAGLAFAAAAAGLAASVKSVIDTADSFSKMSAKTGVAVEALRELNYAASLSDVSTEALGVNMQKLTLNMSKAAGGAKEQSEVFKAMGVSVKDASGQLKGSGDFLQELAGKFANYADGPEKAALAMQIFGESGAAMIPLLNSGAAGLADMAQEARDLGTVFSGDMAKQAEAFNDSLTRIQTLTQSGAITIANELLPTLNLLTKTFLESAKEGKGFGSDVAAGVRVAMEAIVILYSDVEFVLKAMGREIGAFAAQLAALGRLDFKGFTAISDAVKEDGKRAREELDKFQKDVLNARFTTSQAGAGRGTAADPRVLGDIPSMQTVAPVVQKAAEGAKKALKEMGDEFASQRAAAADWAKTMAEFAKIQRDTEATSDGLSKAQARLVEYLGSTAYTDASDEMRELALQSAYAAIASEQLADAKKAEAKALDDSIKAYADLVEAQQGVAQTAAQNLQAQLDQNAAIGLTATELAVLEVAKLNDIAASKEQRASALDIIDTSGQLGNAYRAEAKALRDLASAKEAGAAKQAVADRAKDAADEWKRTSDKIEQDLTDALMRGFESGKGFAENLRDTVANMFKTLVLRPVIQATVQGGLNAVGLGSLGGQGAGSNLLGNVAGNYLTSSLGTAVFGSNAAYGAAVGTTSIGAGSQAAMLAAQTGEFGAAGLAATAQAGGGAMSAFAAAAPWVLGALAVASILSSMDDSGTIHTGGMASYSATGGLQTSTEHGAFGMGFGGVDRGEQTVGMVSGLTRSTVGMLDSTSKLFGGKGGYSVATGFADDTSKDGAWGGLLIKDAQGNTKVNWNDDRTSRWAPREFADGEAGAKQYALAVAKDVRDVLIDETPAWADTMLNALGDAPTLEQLAGTVAQIHAAAAAFDTMGRASEQFAALSESAMDALVTAMGGAEAAVAGLGNYYSSFYTDAERADVTRGQLQDKFTGLGLGTLPQTRDQFRAIVESLDLTTASGRAMYAELIKLSPAFASVTAAVQDTATAVQAAVTEMARAAEQAFEKAKTTAYSQLEASVQRERTLWEQQATAAASLRDEVRGVFDTLATNISELRAEALGPTLSAAQGQAFISQAIAAAQAGAGLPAGADLASAISAARGGLSSPGMYANSMERDFAALRLAGELSVLQEAAGEQLTTAELQLQAAENQIDQLDETLAYWRKLIDGTEDSIDATMAVADAVNALRTLMFPDAAAAKAPDGATAKPGFGGGASTAAPPASSVSRLGNTYTGSLGIAITDAAYVDRFDSINSFVNTLDFSAGNAAASAAALSSAAQQYGVSANEIAIATGYKLEDVQALLPSLPKYAMGTNFVPETGLALLHKGEAVVPQVYNPAATGAPFQPMGGDNGQVVALLQQIAARVTALEGHAAASADANAQSADVLTRVAQGNSLTTSAAPAIA